MRGSGPPAATTRDAIDNLARRAAASAKVINLGGGLPSDAQFPREELAASFVRALQAQGAPALQYGWPEGLASLRTRIAERLSARLAGRRLSADEVVVTSGAQQAIAIAVQLLFRRGDLIGVETATYPAALDLFRSRGLVPAPLERSAMSYVMPTLSNPTGRPLSAELRAQIVSSGRTIIEDDAYGELRFAGALPPLLGVAGPRTIHVGTFSKTLCPGLRVGWLLVPAALRKRALRIKQNDDLQSNSLAQAVVDDYLAHNDFDARLVVLRRFYRRRASRLADAIAAALPAWRFQFPEGGFSLWLEADDAVDEQRFLETAIAEGVAFDVGSTFQADTDRDGPTRLRVCFSSAPPSRFTEAARRLARAWRRVSRRRRQPGGARQRQPGLAHRTPHW